MNRTNVIEDLTLLPLPPWWQNPWILVATVLALTALIGLGVWAARRRPKPAQPTAAPAVPPVPPDEFLRRLAELRERHPRLSAYQLAIEVSEILRAYLEARYRFRILYQTTREFLGEVAHRPELDADQRAALEGFLSRCDEVKFGQAPASPDEQTGLLDTAERVIRQTAGVASKPTPKANP
jgi:hypothetical protein